MTTLLWFRQDLRLRDNPALQAAVQRGEAIVPVFIWSPTEEGDWALGGASCWWLHQSLEALDQDLTRHGLRLILREGLAQRTLEALVEETAATAVYWNRRYEPEIIERDKRVKEALRKKAIDVQSFNGSLLIEPWEIQTKEGKPYQVYTPFWKSAQLKLNPPAASEPPTRLKAPSRFPASAKLNDFKLEPTIPWAKGIAKDWTPGEAGAHQQLARFLDGIWTDYATDRDRPDRLGTSRLSPYLHFGELSPVAIWHGVQRAIARGGKSHALHSGEKYLNEIGWREFAYHLLYHFPKTTREPLRGAYASFPWKKDATALKRWQKGQTGFPIVDAGMRELWVSGWMHNRVRMIVASFLVKDLLIAWQQGAAWFWDTLVDADLANNTLGWQWTAGCGADAAPYFRIYNPILQGVKFDPNGDYVRRWVPELSRMPAEWIHRPWEAPEAVLESAAVELGKTYPVPIVDHSFARDRALEALKTISR